MSEPIKDYSNFDKSYFELLEAINLCLEKNYIIPSLCLIYSGIDSIAWVAFGDIEVKDRFVNFVEQYMYPVKRLNTSSLNLYAARCAILHTMTPNSKLSNNNKAVPLDYAWGKATIEELEKSNAIIKKGNMSCIHINDLVDSFRLGVGNFYEIKGKDAACQKRIKKHYARLSSDLIKNINSNFNEN